MAPESEKDEELPEEHRIVLAMTHDEWEYHRNTGVWIHEDTHLIICFPAGGQMPEDIDIIVELDHPLCRENGIQFYESSDGTIYTPGDPENASIPSSCFQAAYKKDTHMYIFQRDQENLSPSAL